MSELSYTRTLARFAVEARTGDLSPEAVAATKRVALDTLGCAVGGRSVGSSEILTRVRTASGGAAEATVLVGGERLPLAAAAFLNAH